MQEKFSKDWFFAPTIGALIAVGCGFFMATHAGKIAQPQVESTARSFLPTTTPSSTPGDQVLVSEASPAVYRLEAIVVSGKKPRVENKWTGALGSDRAGKGEYSEALALRAGESCSRTTEQTRI